MKAEETEREGRRRKRMVEEKELIEGANGFDSMKA